MRVEPTVGSGVAVLMTPDRAALAAAAALTMPAPQIDVLQELPAGNAVTLDRNISDNSNGISNGLAASISERIPDT